MDEQARHWELISNSDIEGCHIRKQVRLVDQGIEAVDCLLTFQTAFAARESCFLSFPTFQGHEMQHFVTSPLFLGRVRVDNGLNSVPLIKMQGWVERACVVSVVSVCLYTYDLGCLCGHGMAYSSRGRCVKMCKLKVLTA